MRSITRTTTVGVSALLACAGGLAACGSSSSSTSSPTTAATAAVIPLGEIGSFSGALAVTANGVKDGVAAWAAYTNAHGGISGHPVKVYALDDQGSATAGLQDARTLVEQDHVVAFVGEASGSVSAWQKYVEGANIPVVGGQSSETPFLTSADFFGSGTNVLAIQYGNLKLASALGNKFGYTYCAEAAICAQSVALLKALGPSAGVTIPVGLSTSSTAADYTAQCQALKQAGVNAYGLGLVSNTALRVAAACKSQGLNVPVVISDGTVTASWLTTPSLDGTLVVGSDVPYTASSTPATAAFQSAVTQYQPNLGALFGPNVVEGWVSGQLLAKAVEGSGSATVTGASIKTGLYTLKGETLGGMTPPLTYTPGKASPVNCFIPEKIHNGALSTTGSTECAPDSLVSAIAKSF